LGRIYAGTLKYLNFGIQKPRKKELQNLEILFPENYTAQSVSFLTTNGLKNENSTKQGLVAVPVVYAKYSMTLVQKKYIKLVVTVFAVTVLGESNFKEIQKINFSEFVPGSDADMVNLKYTDSGRITAILVSSKMLDYTTVDFPFTEFPRD
jgi:hypothetical protein